MKFESLVVITLIATSVVGCATAARLPADVGQDAEGTLVQELMSPLLAPMGARLIDVQQNIDRDLERLLSTDDFHIPLAASIDSTTIARR
jgi:hypothetical protein